MGVCLEEPTEPTLLELDENHPLELRAEVQRGLPMELFAIRQAASRKRILLNGRADKPTPNRDYVF
jgi:hypothetical protein